MGGEITGLIVTLLLPKDCVAFGCAAVVLVLDILTKAGVGIMLVVFVKLPALMPLAGCAVKAMGCCCCAAAGIVGTKGGGVVGVAIILPEAVVILPPDVLFTVFPVRFCCLAVDV